ncbi:hypothetical protein QFZ20_000786 [Flavobacterium sp. W4I14]|nr:hypothetical protein [Flavobacterium sp. W4I14]
MNFKEQKRQYIDDEGFRLLALIEDKILQPVNKSPKRTPSGSIHEKIALDLTEKMVDSPHIESAYDRTGHEYKKEVYNNRSIGFNGLDYLRVKKLAATASEEKSIVYKISEDFIENKIFKWLVKTHKENRAEKTLSTFLLDEFLMVCKNRRIRFPIVNLDIDNAFEIGKAKFDFFTEDYFNKLKQHNAEQGSTSNEDSYSHIRNKYQGKVFVSFDVVAEVQKAEEIALEYCSLTVDILKMCSDMLDLPDLGLKFDIDSRVKFASQSEVILTMAENELEEFTINMYGPQGRYRIGKKQWTQMLKRGLAVFHIFLINLTDEPTELQSLIVNSIKRFGNAISIHSLHQRIVELFTILESLLLLNTNSPIIESVCRYCSKLVFKKIEDRKQAIELLKIMYDVRSKLIHHGKEVRFDMDNLRKLQYIVVMLLEALINKTKQHLSKQSLLQEIEDAIMQAYD